MKKSIFISSLMCLFYVQISNAQTIRHLSEDIPNSSSFYTVQKQYNWCWAACNQMLLNAVNIPETQENQVIKLFGNLIDRGAGPDYESAKQALAGTYTDSSGKIINISPYISYLGTHKDDPVVIIEQLKKGIPLVMATHRHGRVCVGVDYDTDGINYQITHLRLLNPLNPKGIETFTMAQYTAKSFENGGLMGFMTLIMK